MEIRVEIFGPADVRHRILNFLDAATVGRRQTRAQRMAREKMSSLYEKLVTKGLKAEGTATLVKEWRLYVFTQAYDEVENPVAEGDVTGGGLKVVPLRQSTKNRRLKAYQWKAGSKNVPHSTRNGAFEIRIRAHEKSTAWRISPWLSILLGVANIILSLWLANR